MIPEVTNTQPTPEDSEERLDKQSKEAMDRIAQNAKNTSNDPDSGLYSRKDDQEYANVKPIIQKVWEAVGQKITDTKQRIQAVYDLLVKKFGNPIKDYLRTYVNELRTTIQRRPKNQTPVQSEYFKPVNKKVPAPLIVCPLPRIVIVSSMVLKQLYNILISLGFAGRKIVVAVPDIIILLPPFNVIVPSASKFCVLFIYSN